MIKFYRNYYETIKIQPKEYNIYNSKSWWLPVKTGQLILFPSSTTHSVEVKKGNNTRVSLAFNVFIKGTLGDNKDLTELFL
jgi:predicted 2-oxoglutarate/Fe(II)-dependent dioxygenase YbiX